MAFPKQPHDIESGRRALAPYNFVPLPERVVTLAMKDLPDQGIYGKDHDGKNLLSGYLDCELTTASPLYVRAGITPQYFQLGKDTKDQSDFFYVRDASEPVIPGSSLRGMLRNLVEIASFSKVSSVSDKRPVYRAVGDITSHGENYRKTLMRDEGEKHYTPLMHGGYMVRTATNDWAIRPAKNIGGTTFARIRIDERLFDQLRKVKNCQTAFEIFIETGPYDYVEVKGGFLHTKIARVLRADPSPAKGLRSATLARSGWIFSKKTEAVIYEPDQNVKPLDLDDDQIDAYREQLSKEAKKLLGEKGVLVDGHPVFYVLDEKGKVFFFGHCRMLRLPYPRSPFECVPESLRRDEELDMAEAIFGYSKRFENGQTHAYAGRVSISDATLVPDQKDLWFAPNKTVIPKILSGPKPTTFQHYLVQTRPNKFQIGRTRDGRPKYEIRLFDYASRSPDETVIRGHKLYWHKNRVALRDIQETQQIKSDGDSQHTQMQPVRPGVKFCFKVRFENLSETELGALLWVLQIGSDERYRLKLGMGKPLGMGAVRVNAKLHVIDREGRYAKLFGSDKWHEGASEDETKSRDAIAAFQRFVLGELNEKVARQLEELERIKALLHMLSWPGPDPALTRYMEIERPDPTAKRGKRNEYDGRPVLPTTAQFFEQTISASAPKTAPAKVASTPVQRMPLQEDEIRGVVEKFGLGPNQSYGFIKREGSDKFVFVHKSQLSGGLKTLQAGQPVIFKMGKGMKPVAIGYEDKKDKKVSEEEAQDVRLETQGSPQTPAPRPQGKQISQPTPPPMAPVGFSGTKEKIWVTIVKLMSGNKVQVKTDQGEEAACTNLPGYPASQVGQRFRANVTYEKGKPVKAVFKGWN
ncbi:TIGR03986 family CRISPR-associated RAMP protein [candidate division KSB1 bacterium]|nr:MAG: TIGR03986 family CRISPR-associated RAMP protein [candidate division KSB1 bacterium]